MEPNQPAEQRIIQKSYIRLSMVNMAVLMITNVCGFINNIVISRFLGTQEPAAVGFDRPHLGIRMEERCEPICS